MVAWWPLTSFNLLKTIYMDYITYFILFYWKYKAYTWIAVSIAIFCSFLQAFARQFRLLRSPNWPCDSNIINIITTFNLLLTCCHSMNINIIFWEIPLLFLFRKSAKSEIPSAFKQDFYGFYEINMQKTDLLGRTL